MQPRLKLQPFNAGLQGGEMCHHKSHRGKGSGGKPGEVREQLWCPQTSTVCSHPALVQMAVQRDGKSSCLGWELGMQRFCCQMDAKMGQMPPPQALLMTQIVSSRSTRGFSVAKLIHVFFDWFERGIARSDQVPSEVMNAAQRNIDFHFLIIPCSDCGQDVTTQTGMV